VKKSIYFFFTSFRRKPESSFFKALQKYWTPVFTGVTAGTQFFHSFRGAGGISARPIKANPPISPFFKGGFKSENLFKDKLLIYQVKYSG
jgi:hypothetical protein